MKRTDVAIIGAGISGLYAGWLLEKTGIDYAILEGRPMTGGRLMVCAPDDAPDAPAVSRNDRVDLGATWLWPAIQPQLHELLITLGVTLIPQNETGDMIYERARNQVSRHPGYTSSPAAMRVRGGMRRVTEALEARLLPGRVETDRRVQRITQAGEDILIESVSPEGETHSLHARHVLLALPPALTAAITFDPPLPDALAHAWRNTATWMAPHAKYVAFYTQDFWREQGLSGEARSGAGPMAEIHDVSVPGDVYALFGFLGVPAHTRRATDDATLRQRCRAQLARLFGEAAAHPIADVIKDWANDPFTAAASDLTLQPGHTVPPAVPADGAWQARLTGIASEWSPLFPGYLAGAIDAADEAINALLKRSHDTPGRQ
ncbi:FAD-dependent oxidoreductase [Cronobacter turicensis]|uniref:flavin monoamine oxidase family protein n=1 Tax=Cronobacter turicensis TaxID=413502 RepID=UPI0024AFC726|nr:FAD-dependent oxidoreductase [Cronobacter turicensis]ELY4575932.1 FAD-dependent oxidoreductase [Cronobacter turicensis]MDI7407409.1 FAD-dependent oxidoreductase [Cronobacter turicensis]